MSLSKTIRNNIRSLNSRIDRLAGDTREKTTELRDLYEQRKIAQLAPHQLLLMGLSMPPPQRKKRNGTKDTTM